jgi:ankyrin repeat protein
VPPLSTAKDEQEPESVNPWLQAEAAVVKGDVDTLEAMLRKLADTNPGPMQSTWSGGLRPDYSPFDARAIIVKEHGFANWEAFEAFAEVMKDRRSPVAQFERAADAIADGDIATLERLLRDNPGLIRARSTRLHNSTLLHYVGANGVENFRQRTPKNAVDVARVLLDAGADINATAGLYDRGSTTLGLIATSLHPVQAGVQNELMALFLERGATAGIPGPSTAWSSLINGCHANGRGDAALFLAGRAPAGALDLEAAAGTGRLDIVRTFFTPDTNRQDADFARQLIDGFTWACEFGRTEVVEFLLQQGVDVGARLKHNGQTGLHWAAYGGHADTLRVILRHNPPIDAKDHKFEGTALGWALYGWGSGGPRAADRRGYYDVVTQLVDAGATTTVSWLEHSLAGLLTKILGDEEMRAAAVRGAIK